MYTRRNEFEFFDNAIDLGKAKNTLNYTEFNIHHVAPVLIPTINLVKISLLQLLKETKQKIESLSGFAGLFRQVGVYLAFYSKEKKVSCDFLNIYLLQCKDNTKAWAHASCLLGIAEMLDENYVEKFRFETALKVLSGFADANDILFMRAMNLQQLAAIQYRKEDYASAASQMADVIAIYSKLPKDVVLPAAEASAYHLQGEILKHSDQDAALMSFAIAKKLWEQDYENALDAIAQRKNNSEPRIVAFPNAQLPLKHKTAALTDLAITELEAAVDQKRASPRHR